MARMEFADGFDDWMSEFYAQCEDRGIKHLGIVRREAPCFVHVSIMLRDDKTCGMGSFGESYGEITIPACNMRPDHAAIAVLAYESAVIAHVGAL